jgi:hypothetical protein
MTTWTTEELVDTGGSDELRIAPRRSDGTLQPSRIIWWSATSRISTFDP